MQMAPLDAVATQRILVVDDDRSILDMVAQKLEHAGYGVTSASSGEVALSLIAAQGLPHLAIVDLVMPGMGGFAFCEQVHSFCDLPIILLTAVDEEDTVVRGLQFYAEDYVVKPFSPRQLVARVERILRRIQDFGYTTDREVAIDASLRVGFAHQEVRVDGTPVHLTPTETKLLYILLRNAGHVVPASYLLQRLWPLEEAYEEKLRVHVRRLRAKLERDPGSPTYIVTERGSGYRFAVS